MIVTRSPSWKYSVAFRRGCPVRAPRDSSSAAATGAAVLNRPLVSLRRYGSTFQATLTASQAPALVAENRHTARYRRPRRLYGSTWRSLGVWAMAVVYRLRRCRAGTR